MTHNFLCIYKYLFEQFFAPIASDVRDLLLRIQHYKFRVRDLDQYCIRHKKGEDLHIANVYTFESAVFSQYSFVFATPASRASEKSKYLSLVERVDHALWSASSAGKARWSVGPVSVENACCADSEHWQ